MKRSSLNKRYTKSFETKDSGKKNTIFNFPNDILMYKPEEIRNKINIIPYVVKSKNHPMVKSGDFEIGDLDYLMDVYIHRNIGVSNEDILCLKKNYNKPCPICELADEYREKGEEDRYKEIKAFRRVYYNVIDVRKPDLGLQIFSSSHFLFEKELIEEARDNTDGNSIIDFADIDNGKVISFRGSSMKIGKNEFLEYKSFSFEDREEKLDKDLINEAISFDEIMKVLSYDEIMVILYGKNNDENNDDSDDDSNKKYDDNKDIEEQEIEKDKKQEKKLEKNENKCPHGYNFPKDWDKKPECDKCKIWDLCDESLTELKRKERNNK